MGMIVNPYAQGVLSAFSFINSATGTSSTISMPSGAQDKDFCVILDTARNSNPAGVPASVTPSGFTSEQDNGGNAGSFDVGRGIISAKKLDGTETTVTGMSGTRDSAWLALLFRPNGPFSSFAWNSPNGQATTGNPTAQSIAMAGATLLPIIGIGQIRGFANPGGEDTPARVYTPMTELIGSNVGGVDVHFGHYIIYNQGSTPANITYDTDDSNNINLLQSGYFSFTP